MMKPRSSSVTSTRDEMSPQSHSHARSRTPRNPITFSPPSSSCTSSIAQLLLIYLFIFNLVYCPLRRGLMLDFTYVRVLYPSGPNASSAPTSPAASPYWCAFLPSSTKSRAGSRRIGVGIDGLSHMFCGSIFAGGFTSAALALNDASGIRETLV